MCVFLRWIQCQSCLISHWTTAMRSQEKVCITYLVLTMSWLYLEFGVALILPGVSTLSYCIALRMRTWMCTLSGLDMMIRILCVPSVNILILSNGMSHTWISCCTFSMLYFIHASLFPSKCTIGFTTSNISAANHSHFQGVTRIEDMYSVLCRLSSVNGKIKLTVCLACCIYFQHL